MHAIAQFFLLITGHHRIARHVLPVPIVPTSQGYFCRPALLDQQHFYEQLNERRSKTVQVRICDRHSGEEIWERSFNGHRFCRNVYGNPLITDINFTYLIKLNLDSGNESWNYTLPEGEKVAGKIYLNNDVLVVPSKSGQGQKEKIIFGA